MSVTPAEFMYMRTKRHDLEWVYAECARYIL